MTVTPRFAGLFYRPYAIAAPGCAEPVKLFPLFAENAASSPRDPRSGERVTEGLRAHRDDICARIQQVSCVTPGLHPAHADDGDR